MRWFKPLGFFFVPVSIPGWMISVLAAAFCVHIFLLCRRAFQLRFRHAVWSFSLLGADVPAVDMDRRANQRRRLGS